MVCCQQLGPGLYAESFNPHTEQARPCVSAASSGSALPALFAFVAIAAIIASGRKSNPLTCGFGL